MNWQIINKLISGVDDLKESTDFKESAGHMNFKLISGAEN
jgi:hypothetical protein